MGRFHMTTIFTDVGVVLVFFDFEDTVSANAALSVGACASTEAVLNRGHKRVKVGSEQR